MSAQRYSIETLDKPNWIYVLDRETGDCIAYYEWREGATAGRPGSRQWARECAEQAMADRIRDDAAKVVDAGLRRIGHALVIWSAMARASRLDHALGVVLKMGLTVTLRNGVSLTGIGEGA